MAGPKKHHYVQRAYLHRWSDKDGDIYICDLANGNIHKGPAKSAAWGKYYYCLEDPDHPEYRFEIEEFLANYIEDPANPLIDKLDQETELNQAEKSHLALYIAFQRTRVPYFKKFSDELTEIFHKEAMLKILKDEKLFGRFMAENAEKHKILKRIPSREEMIKAIEEGRVKMKYPRASSLKSMLEVSVPLSDLYSGLQWILLRGKGSAYITSDNPATTMSFAKKTGDSRGETTFPISPQHCILIDQEIQGKVAIVEEEESDVWEVNRRTLLHATRYLFGNNQNLLQECYEEYVRLEPLRLQMTTTHLNNGKLVGSGEKLFTKRNLIL